MLSVKIAFTGMIVFLICGMVSQFVKGKPIEDKPEFFIPLTLIWLLSLFSALGAVLWSVWSL